jgi:hypothetical protein
MADGYDISAIEVGVSVVISGSIRWSELQGYSSIFGENDDAAHALVLEGGRTLFVEICTAPRRVNSPLVALVMLSWLRR